MPQSALYQKIQAEARAQRGRSSDIGVAERAAEKRAREKAAAEQLTRYFEQRATELSLAEIAGVIRRDWTPPYFAAVPYIDALLECDRDGDTFGPGREAALNLVRYFLANAGTWRGPVARVVKAELRRRAGVR